jgi:myo-inositol-1(or 4)-monophosphatase
MREVPRYTAPSSAAERELFLPFASELAAVAAAVIRPWHLSRIAVDIKADATPVTVADRRAEEVMRALIAQRFPEHGVLGEEFGDHLPDARYRWVLDPIDGTKSFIANSFLFGTLIALLRDGRPILGAIASPLTGHVLVGTGDAAGWANLKRRFAKARKIKEVGMARALQMVGLPLDGSHHRGLDDARNIAELQPWSL